MIEDYLAFELPFVGILYINLTSGIEVVKQILMISVSFLMKLNKLMMLTSPRTINVNEFYNWFHYVVKLLYGFTQFYLVDYKI